jgi:hypothetical protein
MKSFITGRYKTLIVAVIVCVGVLVWRQFMLHWIAQRHEQINWIPPTGSPLGVREFRLDKDKVPSSLRSWGETLAIDFIWFESDKLAKADWRRVGADQPRVDEIRRLFPEATVISKTTSEWDTSGITRGGLLRPETESRDKSDPDQEEKIIADRRAWFKTHPVNAEIDIEDIPGFHKFSRGDPYARPSRRRCELGDEIYYRIYVLSSTSADDKQKAAKLFPEADILEIPGSYPN